MRLRISLRAILQTLVVHSVMVKIATDVAPARRIILSLQTA
jgi:hypothetical protein